MYKKIPYILIVLFAFSSIACVCATSDADNSVFDDVPAIVAEKLDINNEGGLFELVIEYVINYHGDEDESVNAIAEDFNVNEDDAYEIYAFLANYAAEEYGINV